MVSSHFSKVSSIVLSTSALTFSKTQIVGLFISIARRHSHSKDDAVPDPSSPPSRRPAILNDVHGEEYVNNSNESTAFQSSFEMSP